TVLASRNLRRKPETETMRRPSRRALSADFSRAAWKGLAFHLDERRCSRRKQRWAGSSRRNPLPPERSRLLTVHPQTGSTASPTGAVLLPPLSQSIPLAAWKRDSAMLSRDAFSKTYLTSLPKLYTADPLITTASCPLASRSNSLRLKAKISVWMSLSSG